MAQAAQQHSNFEKHACLVLPAQGFLTSTLALARLQCLYDLPVHVHEVACRALVGHKQLIRVQRVQQDGVHTRVLFLVCTTTSRRPAAKTQQQREHSNGDGNASHWQCDTGTALPMQQLQACLTYSLPAVTAPAPNGTSCMTATTAMQHTPSMSDDQTD